MVIYLYGPDTFRSKRKLKEIKDKFIKEIDRSSLNLQTFDGASLDLVELNKALSTPAFLAEKKMVIIENLISKNKGQKIQKELLEILDKKNLEKIILVFYEGAEKTNSYKKAHLAASRGKALENKLKKEKFAQEFKLLTNAEVRKFITQELGEIAITAEAAQLLADITGSDLWRASSELQKLRAYTGGKKIEISDVNNLVQSKLEDDIFKLTDALGQKNKALCLKLINQQLALGTSALELLSKLAWQFKNLLIIKAFIEQNGPGYNPTQISYQVGLHPFVVKKTLDQAQNFNLKNLKKSYQQISKIDYKLKTSQVNAEALFDLLIVSS